MLTPQRVLTSDPVFTALITAQESGMGFVLQRLISCLKPSPYHPHCHRPTVRV